MERLPVPLRVSTNASLFLRECLEKQACSDIKVPACEDTSAEVYVTRDMLRHVSGNSRPRAERLLTPSVGAASMTDDGVTAVCGLGSGAGSLTRGSLPSASWRPPCNETLTKSRRSELLPFSARLISPEVGSYPQMTKRIVDMCNGIEHYCPKCKNVFTKQEH